MSRQRERALKVAQDSRDGQNFLPLTIPVLKSTALAKLSPHATKLLLDICSQWRLGHNGDISATWAIMKQRGWKSKDTLSKALKELSASELIILTRQGGRHLCSLFGLGWLAIDECGGKLDIKSTSKPIKQFDGLLKIKSSATPRVSISRKIVAIDPISVSQEL